MVFSIWPIRYVASDDVTSPAKITGFFVFIWCTCSPSWHTMFINFSMFDLHWSQMDFEPHQKQLVFFLFIKCIYNAKYQKHTVHTSYPVICIWLLKRVWDFFSFCVVSFRLLSLFTTHKSNFFFKITTITTEKHGRSDGSKARLIQSRSFRKNTKEREKSKTHNRQMRRRVRNERKSARTLQRKKRKQKYWKHIFMTNIHLRGE